MRSLDRGFSTRALRFFAMLALRTLVIAIKSLVIAAGPFVIAAEALVIAVRTLAVAVTILVIPSGARNLRRPAAGKNQIPRCARNDKAALGMTSVEVLANNKHFQERAFLCASVVRVP